MNAVSRSFIRYAALRRCLRGIAILSLLSPFTARNLWAQPVPGDDENVLPEEEAQEPETSPATDEADADAAPRELPRKAKKPSPAVKPPLQSRARVEKKEREAPLQPGAVRIHLETPVPAALYDVGTGPVQPGKQPPDNQLVCHAPCDAQVDVSDEQVFSVWAPNMEMSEPFTLKDDAREVVVTFEPAPSTLNDVGLTIGCVGLGFAALGGSILIYGAEKGDLSDGGLAAAGVTLGGGAILMLIGTPMMLAARYPEVTVREKPAGEAFAIDKRPTARAARPWLGEF